MDFFEVLNKRKSVRDYSDKAVEKRLIEKIIAVIAIIIFLFIKPPPMGI